MTKKVLISQADIKDIYRMALSACDLHQADKYAANLFSRVLFDWIISQPGVEDEKSTDQFGCPIKNDSKTQRHN